MFHKGLYIISNLLFRYIGLGSQTSTVTRYQLRWIESTTWQGRLTSVSGVVFFFLLQQCYKIIPQSEVIVFGVLRGFSIVGN